MIEGLEKIEEVIHLSWLQEEWINKVSVVEQHKKAQKTITDFLKSLKAINDNNSSDIRNTRLGNDSLDNSSIS